MKCITGLRGSTREVIDGVLKVHNQDKTRNVDSELDNFWCRKGMEKKKLEMRSLTYGTGFLIS